MRFNIFRLLLETHNRLWCKFQEQRVVMCVRVGFHLQHVVVRLVIRDREVRFRFILQDAALRLFRMMELFGRLSFKLFFLIFLVDLDHLLAASLGGNTVVLLHL